ncbi:hypothetical protein OIV83_005963 [Microbotryomycetes sp. JL201]|nr:hypothetical protein OIV83_005963 [Microbotryomycetes sp. JL201]
MRIPLELTAACTTQLSVATLSTDPPLAFIDNEPFLIELQGTLENPSHDPDSAVPGQDMMRGVQVGKLDLQVPTKPILRIAHHRLEGKLVALTEPYAILKTTRSLASRQNGEPPLKRMRSVVKQRDGNDSDSQTLLADDNDDEDQANAPRIEIAGIVRRKIVFSKRPEPLIELSSDAVAPPSSDI